MYGKRATFSCRAKKQGKKTHCKDALEHEIPMPNSMPVESYTEQPEKERENREACSNQQWNQRQIEQRAIQTPSTNDQLLIGIQVQHIGDHHAHKGAQQRQSVSKDIQILINYNYIWT